MLLEEERRLFYVALTRAKDELFLITRSGNESSFLEEIPEAYSVNFSQKPTQIAVALSTCEHCNFTLKPDFKFCPNCGTEVLNTGNPKSE
jgi:ATP-dependent exoDNAse (exonuclease V) beta subunit